MKIQVNIDIDLETGKYEMGFKTKENSNKEGIDYFVVKEFLQNIFNKWTNEIENSGIDSDENIIKDIH